MEEAYFRIDDEFEDEIVANVQLKAKHHRLLDEQRRVKASEEEALSRS